MIALPFATYNFSFKDENGKRKIFDIVRKKFVLLTPEEWVRQNVIHFLINQMQYPKTMFSVEKTLTINGLKKRFDIVVYNSAAQPWMLIECKEPEVNIDDNVLRQLLGYQHTLQCKYWVLTNGNSTYCAVKNNENINWIENLPEYE